MRIACVLILILVVGCSDKSDWEKKEIKDLLDRYKKSESFYVQIFSENFLHDFIFFPSPEVQLRILEILKNSQPPKPIDPSLYGKVFPFFHPIPPSWKIVYKHAELPALELDLWHGGSLIRVRCGNKEQDFDTEKDAEELVKLFRAAQAAERVQRQDILLDHVLRYTSVFFVASTNPSDWQQFVLLVKFVTEDFFKQICRR